MDGVALLQMGAALILNGGFAWLTGVVMARRWLLRCHPGLLDDVAPLLRLSAVLAALAALLATGASLWAAAALMGDVGLGEALDMLPTVATGTAYGHMGLIAMAAMATLAVLMAGKFHDLLAVAMLLVFALARACISHAGEQGVPSVAYCLEVVHLLLVGAWLGGVAIAAWIVLPAARRSGVGIAPYLQALSTAATIALAGIVASGAFNAWQRLDSLSQLTATSWALALVVKLVVFAAAVLLGAYNRWWGFPGAGRDGAARATLVLRIESVVLIGALAAAACLTVQPPPG